MTQKPIKMMELIEKEETGMTEKRMYLKAFRLTQSENEILELIALREGRSVSETLRECIREAAQHRGIFPPGLVVFERGRTQ